jgi:hypothetical protein
MVYKDKEKERIHSKEYHRKYYLENKERMKKTQQEYYKSEKGKAYLARKKEKRKESIIKWYKSKGKEYYDQNKERINGNFVKWYHSEKGEENRIANVVYKEKLRLKREYGITPEERNEMFKNQNGKCAICGRHQSEFKKIFNLDHNHSTGKIRGLLCFRCNCMLGFATDDLNILKKAIKYLEMTDEQI